eukprot:2103310-Rhodomonas_salina.3
MQADANSTAEWLGSTRTRLGGGCRVGSRGWVTRLGRGAGGPAVWEAQVAEKDRQRHHPQHHPCA